MQMNTTAKGDRYEDRVFTILQKLLQDDALFVPGKRSTIFRKKGYYSKDRDAEIIFDISIETCLPGETNYSLLTLIECKDYKTSVPVNDVEEFAGKVSQVGQHNTKAVIIANSNFQKSALAFARSQRLALVRVTPKDEVQWILHRKADAFNTCNDTHLKAFLFDHPDKLIPFAASFEDWFIQSLPDLLLKFDVIDHWRVRDEYLSVPYLEASDIDEILDRFSIGRHLKGQMLDMDSLCEQLSDLYQVDFDFSRDLEKTGNGQALGKIVFSPLQIYIHKGIEDKYCFRYTLAHEIGHLLLHLYLLQPHFESRRDSAGEFDLAKPFTSKVTARLETQANMLASQLLLPTRSIIYTVLRYFQRHDIHHGHLFVDWQPCNQHAYFLLMNEIQQTYGVSKEVARFRLVKLGLLVDTMDCSMQTILEKNGFLSAIA